MGVAEQERVTGVWMSGKFVLLGLAWLRGMGYLFYPLLGAQFFLVTLFTTIVEECLDWKYPMAPQLDHCGQK